MGLVTTLYTTITQPRFTLLTTDRLIVKYFALKTAGGGPRNICLTYDGTNNVSYVRVIFCWISRTCRF
jgi:hypothetical protein